jgi:quaternary ammonium compound-resistance protein SugE
LPPALGAINPWVWLAMAGLGEVAWVVLLKQSDGFTRLWASAATVLSMAVSFFCMSQSLRVLPMGTVYAVWTGIGAAGGLVWGIAMEGEPAGILRIACVALILAGVAGLKITTP